MEPQAVVHDTFVLERTYPTAPDRVFSYFADTAKKRRWFGEAASHDVEAFELDFRVGGAERNRYRMNAATPFPGTVLANEGIIQEIVDGRRVVTATTMTLGDRRISSALITIELFPDGTGTKLVCTHQAAFYEGADGPQMRKDGWEQLFDKLARVVAD
jgi:uncharacterized protein YndB with AHSA1/START domain